VVSLYLFFQNKIESRDNSLKNIRKESAEVLYRDGDKVVTKGNLEELKTLAKQNPRQRVRLCTHNSPADKLHEMFIVHMRHCYIRPHKHISKAESLLILEGEVDVILFNDDGSIKQVVSMGSPDTGQVFYHRLSLPIYHMLIIRTEFLVFQENTEGPFLRNNTVFPDWAPVDEGTGSQKYIEKINSLISKEWT